MTYYTGGDPVPAAVYVGTIIASDYGDPGSAAFDMALLEAGSLDRTIVLTPGTWGVSSAAVPANVNLKIEKGAIIAVADGETQTINGPLDAGPYQIFSCAGTGKVTLSGTKTIECVWFASGSGTAASPWTDGFRHAYNGSGAGHVYHLQAGTWKDTSTINVTTSSTIIQGDGKGLTYWHYTAADGTSLLNIANGGAQLISCRVEDIYFAGSEPTASTVGVATGAAIAYNNLCHSTFRGLSIGYFNAGVAGGTSKGISADTGYNNQFLQIYGYKTSILLSFEDGSTDLDWDLIHIQDIMTNASDTVNDTYGIKMAGIGSRFQIDGTNDFDQVKYGIYYVNDALATVQYGWRFSGCFFESVSATTTAVTLKVGSAGGGSLQNVEFQNCNIGSTFVTAFDLGGIAYFKLTSVSYGGGAGKTWIASTAKVYPMIFENCTYSTSATFTLDATRRRVFWMRSSATGSGTYEIYEAYTAEQRLEISSPIVKTIQTLTYSTSIDVDASLGDVFIITVTDGVAFDITNPTNMNAGQEIMFIIRNSAGGAMGAITWGNKFAFVSSTKPAEPANTKYNIVKFMWTGAVWLETTRSVDCLP